MPQARAPGLTEDAAVLLDTLMAGRPSGVRQQGIEALRRGRGVVGSITGAVRAATERRTAALEGAPGVRAAVTTPVGADAPGVVVYLHGGGWCVGDPDETESFQRLLAVETGCLVVAPAYPLAPEAPFPAAVRACRAALAAVLDVVAAGRPVVLVGDSAGGNLAIASARVTARLAGLALLHPVTDSDLSRPSYAAYGADGGWLTTDDMRWFWEQYAPAPADRASPDAAPVRASDLGGLPPTAVYLAGCDPLRDEGQAFADAVSRTGVPVSCTVDEGHLHGFVTHVGTIPSADAAVRRLAADVRRFLGLPAAGTA